MAYSISPGVRVVTTPQGDFLLGEKPLRFLKLNRPLLELVKRGMKEPLTPSTEAESKVLEALVSRWFAVRNVAGANVPATLPFVSIIIPVMDRAEELGRCLDSIAKLRYPKENLELIVVDDGSRDNSKEVAASYGAVVLDSGGTGTGPAAARNCGFRAARGELLAFIDSDCIASPEWLEELVGLFEDPVVAAVGGLVDGMHTSSFLDRYELVMSSLTLGNRERSGQKGDDTFYLPSCNLLVRSSAFREASGFNPEMHVGEDVDLTWRMRDSGHRIIYMPKGRIGHEHRNAFFPFLKRRFQYGTSEAMLQILHPVRQKRMIVPPVLAVALVISVLSIVTLSPVGATSSLALMATDSFLSRRRLTRLGLTLDWGTIFLARLRALGSLAYYIAFHLIRYYMTPLTIASLMFPHFGAALLVTLLGVGLMDYIVRKPRLFFLPFFFYYTMEQYAYGAGVFWGCLKLRRFSTYRMHLLKQMEPII
ncbi:MAG TPA: mycofactocin biosynthesis glycosyltransferase MftF [Geobacteraceae bacterium]|nr:mycofactocin biosynthesis glycosyltransferase MftF [Geobacteraceae bacterium]